MKCNMKILIMIFIIFCALWTFVILNMAVIDIPQAVKETVDNGALRMKEVRQNKIMHPYLDHFSFIILGSR